MALYKSSPISGGEPKETTLWTNDSPTSSFGSLADINLSDSMANYDVVRVYFRYSIYGAGADQFYIDVSYDEFKDRASYSGPSSGNGLCPGVSIVYQNNYYARIFWYFSDTSILVQGAKGLGNALSNNALIIPIKVCGLKY